MAIRRIVIGNKEKIVSGKEGKTKWNEIIANAAAMTEAEVQAYLEEHFSTLKAKEKAGIEMVLKLAWACANVLKTEAKLSLANREEVRVV